MSRLYIYGVHSRSEQECLHTEFKWFTRQIVMSYSIRHSPDCQDQLLPEHPQRALITLNQKIPKCFLCDFDISQLQSRCWQLDIYSSSQCWANFFYHKYWSLFESWALTWPTSTPILSLSVSEIQQTTLHIASVGFLQSWLFFLVIFFIAIFGSWIEIVLCCLSFSSLHLKVVCSWSDIQLISVESTAVCGQHEQCVSFQFLPCFEKSCSPCQHHALMLQCPFCPCAWMDDSGHKEWPAGDPIKMIPCWEGFLLRSVFLCLS